MDAIDTLLNRGVDTIYPSKEELERLLRTGKKLRVYQGFDPTGIHLHIGHAVGFRKLRQFQDLGHEVIFLIGDGTGQAGDPSGKTRTREKFLTREQLRENGKTYVLQSSKIVRFDGKNPVRIVYNGDWLSKLTLADILDIAGHFTLQQMLERDLYQQRIKSNVDLSLREFLYPLLQGYDSVVMDVDLELGGTDQTFNMLAGRKLLRQMKGKEKFVMTVPLLTDSKGVKIGKTEGNVIGLTDDPADFYGKIMALSDDAIIPCFTLLTDLPLNEINAMQKDLSKGKNAMEYKKRLAWMLTAWLNSNIEADKAQNRFEMAFQKKRFVARDFPALKLVDPHKTTWLVSDFLLKHGLVTSKSEAKRLIKQGAIDINNATVKEDADFRPRTGDSVRIGKKKLYRLQQ